MSKLSIPNFLLYHNAYVGQDILRQLVQIAPSLSKRELILLYIQLSQKFSGYGVTAVKIGQSIATENYINNGFISLPDVSTVTSVGTSSEAAKGGDCGEVKEKHDIDTDSYLLLTVTEFGITVVRPIDHSDTYIATASIRPSTLLASSAADSKFPPNAGTDIRNKAQEKLPSSIRQDMNTTIDADESSPPLTFWTVITNASLDINAHLTFVCISCSNPYSILCQERYELLLARNGWTS